VSQNLIKVATTVDIMRLKEQGLPKRAIAKRLGISKDTVSKYWNTANLELRQPCYSGRAQLIDPYRDYITSRLENYPDLSAKRLYEEIKKKGFKGSERTVRRHVQKILPAKLLLSSKRQIFPTLSESYYCKIIFPRKKFWGGYFYDQSRKT